MDETELIKKRYYKRIFNTRYSFLNPDVYHKFQERQRKLIELLKQVDKTDFQNLRVLEIGCGTGTNLIEFILLGFNAQNLTGIELLDQRINEARSRLPSSVNLILGDAVSLQEFNDKFDIVYQSTVFSSILDDKFQENLAKKMLQWVKPEGLILWYDFTFNNPQNKDVRGVNLKRIKILFPDCDIIKYKITLAPPIARLVTKINARLYPFFNIFIPLRTHLLCAIRKV